MFRTIFLIRARYEGVHVDSRETFAGVEHITDAFRAEHVAAKLLDTAPDIKAVFDQFPEATSMVRAWEHMGLRKRVNNDIYGPYNVTSEDDPTDEELVAWWQAKVGRG